LIQSAFDKGFGVLLDVVEPGFQERAVALDRIFISDVELLRAEIEFADSTAGLVHRIVASVEILAACEIQPHEGAVGVVVMQPPTASSARHRPAHKRRTAGGARRLTGVDRQSEINNEDRREQIDSGPSQDRECCENRRGNNWPRYQHT
jgi:hypothetical protein